ncbi:MAG: glycosyltransferase [Bacteroidales bacterium]|nr:glycosyltransferase [Bacteroidales bacterium]
MKTISYILLAFATMVNACSCGYSGEEEYDPNKGGGGDKPAEKVVLHERAAAVLEVINREYRYQNNGTYLFHEEAGAAGSSFLWPYVGMMSGLNALTKLGYDVNLETYADNMLLYWRTPSGKLPAFGSSTNGMTGGGTRYYDDNGIAGIELVDAYLSTGKKTYLDRCGDIYRFTKDAVDDVIATALWWNEDQKNMPSVEDSNKPSCANGYCTKFLLKYYRICPENEKAAVLELAKTLYSFLRNTLMDPSDKCYWNDIGADNIINKTKWTYNTGVMIENGVMLYEITKDQTYLNHAKESAAGSFGYFVKSRDGLNLAYPNHDPWFNTKLVLGYIAIAPHWKTAKDYIEAYKIFVETGWKSARTSNGLFYEDWAGKSQGRYQQLLMQAAVLEAYGVMALYYGEKKN